jgi:type II secretory pathway component GspD/PulD (secretin)
MIFSCLALGTALMSVTQAADQERNVDTELFQFSYEDASIEEVLHGIAASLERQFWIDRRVAALITYRSPNPVPREALLEELGSLLRANGLDLREYRTGYVVIPLGSTRVRGTDEAQSVKRYRYLSRRLMRRSRDRHGDGSHPTDGSGRSGGSTSQRSQADSIRR